MSKTLRVSDFYGGAEMSWVRSVLGPKCPYILSSQEDVWHHTGHPSHTNGSNAYER